MSAFKFETILNELTGVKNDAKVLTKSILENDEVIGTAIDNAIEILEDAEDSCKNPGREIQRPITKIYTEKIDLPKGDELFEKVVNRFEGYKKTYEEAGVEVQNLVKKSKESCLSLKEPIHGLLDVTNDCYNKYKNHVNDMTQPLLNIIEGFEIAEFRKKRLTDPNKVKKFEELLKELKETFVKYNDTTVNFNKVAQAVFKKIEENNLVVSDYCQKTLFSHIKKIPELLSKGIVMLPKVANELKNCPSGNDEARGKYFDGSLSKLLEVTKALDGERIQSEAQLDKESQELGEKSKEMKDEVNKEGEKYITLAKDLRTYGQDILDIVEEIRKLFDLPPINRTLSADTDYPFYEYSKKMKGVCNRLEEVRSIIKPALKLIMVVVGKQINRVTIDMMFIMDITISMADLLDETRNSIKYIVDKIKNDCPGIDIRFGLEGYRDHFDLQNGDKYHSIDFSSDVESFKKQLDEITARGGGDDAEDVAGGFDAALNMSWKSNARYAVFIADAPGHGKKYHEEDVEDDYPDGDPNGLVFEDIIKQYCKKNINLTAIRLDDYTDITFNIIKDIYAKEVTGKLNCQFQIIEYDEEEDGGVKIPMKDKIASRAIQIYGSYSGKEALGETY